MLRAVWPLAETVTPGSGFPPVVMAPVLVIWGGKETPPNTEELEKLGTRIALYPVIAATAGLQASWEALNDLREKGTQAIDGASDLGFKIFGRQLTGDRPITMGHAPFVQRFGENLPKREVVQERRGFGECQTVLIEKRQQIRRPTRKKRGGRRVGCAPDVGDRFDQGVDHHRPAGLIAGPKDIVTDN